MHDDERSARLCTSCRAKNCPPALADQGERITAIYWGQVVETTPPSEQSTKLAGADSASRLMLRPESLAAAGAKLYVDPRMTESSDTSDTPAKPQDYAGLRAELATLVNDFSPLINELWPRLEDHKYRWELHLATGCRGIRQAGCRRHHCFC